MCCLLGGRLFFPSAGQEKHPYTLKMEAENVFDPPLYTKLHGVTCLNAVNLTFAKTIDHTG
jgi:hypothetical protein